MTDPQKGKSLKEVVDLINSNNPQYEICESFFDKNIDLDNDQNMMNLLLQIQAISKNAFIICPSAERCIFFIKKLHKILPEFKVAKLFSRHLKIEDQIKFIKRFKPKIFVGTPNRILKLKKSKNLNEMNYILMDSKPNVKNRNLLEITEIYNDVLTLLGSLHENLVNQSTKLIWL